MKNFITKLAVVLVMLLAFITVSSAYADNNVKREGNTFVSTSIRSTEKSEPIKTKFTYKDNKDIEYPIYISKNNSCFIIKTSKKTGKKYRSYLSAEISIQICKELGVEYKKPTTSSNSISIVPAKNKYVDLGIKAYSSQQRIHN